MGRLDSDGVRQSWWIPAALVLFVWAGLLGSVACLYHVESGLYEHTLAAFVAHEQAEIRGIYDREIASGGSPQEARGRVVELLRQAFEQKAFGESGEFVLGERRGERIVLLLRREVIGAHDFDLVVRGSTAEPMSRALLGEQGVMQGVDHSGRLVLAAYGPAQGDLGLVAKVDVSEIRGPFYVVGGVTTLLVALYSVLLVCAFVRAYRRRVAQLREERGRLSAVVDNILEAVVTIDERGIVRSFNRAAVEIFGYQPEEVCGKNVSLLLSEPARSEHDAYLARFLRTGEARVIGKGTEVVGLNKSGDEISLFLSLGQVQTDRGRIFVGTLRDLTEEKRGLEIESRLQSSQRLESLGTMASGIAHDFNNMLTPILGYSAILLEQHQGDAKTKRWLEEILQAGQRSKALVSRILNFARDSSVEGEVRAVSLAAIIGEVSPLLEVGLPANVSLVVDGDQGLPSVRGHPGQLYRIVMNLAANAGHAMRDQGGTLRMSLHLGDPQDDPELRLSPEEPAKEHVCFSVRDSGHGMSVDVLARIFEPFFTTKPVGEGSGLGLAAVHGIVRRHGGAIAVETRPGEGTTVRVYIPLHEAEVEVRADPQPVLAARRQGAEGGPSG